MHRWMARAAGGDEPSVEAWAGGDALHGGRTGRQGSRGLCHIGRISIQYGSVMPITTVALWNLADMCLRQIFQRMADTL